MPGAKRRRDEDDGGQVAPTPIKSISKPIFPKNDDGTEANVTYPDLDEKLQKLKITGQQSLPSVKDQKALPSTSNDENVPASSMTKNTSPPRPTYAQPTFASEPEDASPVEEPDPRLTKEKYEKIAEFRKLVKDYASFYERLGLPNFAEKGFERAWRLRSADFHSDKNGFPEARECQALIDEAYATLSDAKEKAKYDKQLKKDIRKGKHVPDDPFEPGESFAKNAWGRANDEEPDLQRHERFDDEPSIPPRREIKKPDTAVRELQGKAAEYVKTLISETNSERRSDARMHIESINKMIRHENKKSNILKEAYTIKYNDLLPMAKDIQNVASFLGRQNMANVADDLSQGVLLNFRKLCERPENQWPETWVDFVKASISDIYRRAGREFVAARQRPGDAGGRNRASSRQQPKHREAKTDAEGDVDMLDEDSSSSASGDTGIESTREEASSATDYSSEDNDERGLMKMVRPGRTLDGKKILGYRPWFGYRADGTPYGVTFVVMVGGKNPIELRPGVMVGKTARDAYFRLPKNRQNEIKHKSALNHRDNFDTDFDRIIGYACYPKPHRATLPDGVAWCRLKDGTEKLTSLGPLRVRLGQDVADFLISDFYRKKDLALPYGQLKLLPPIGRSQRLLGWSDDFYDQQRGRKKGVRGPRRRDYDSEVDSSDSVSESGSGDDDYSSDSGVPDIERDMGHKAQHLLRNRMQHGMGHRDTRSHGSHRNDQSVLRYSKQRQGHQKRASDVVHRSVDRTRTRRHRWHA